MLALEKCVHLQLQPNQRARGVGAGGRWRGRSGTAGAARRAVHLRRIPEGRDTGVEEEKIGCTRRMPDTGEQAWWVVGEEDTGGEGEAYVALSVRARRCAGTR